MLNSGSPEVSLKVTESLVTAADSTGQRNRFAEHLSGRPEAERLARPLVQLSRDRVELQLGVVRDVDALWHVLPEQPVRVLVASTLQGALRVAEVDLDVRGQRELLVCWRRPKSEPLNFRRGK
jgi:hypothetical protein